MSTLRCQNCNIETMSLFPQEACNYHKNCNNIKAGKILVCKYCKKQFEDNEAIRKKIIDSDSKFKLVVGGPGTGKTYLFKSLLEASPENSEILVITFINNLVEDLSEQLGRISNRDIKVKTLHGFCKGFLLQKIHPYIYFPELAKIVEKDAVFLGLTLNKKELGREIANIKDGGSNIKFYLSRAEYYNATGHDDAVFRVYMYLKDNPETIPKYAQVIIDEYQDFNPLEANIINLLAKNSYILVAGDDDQALYRFKSASPEFVRDLHKNPDLDHHYLVYCRRCTSVLVRATNAFIEDATKNKMLKNRINKKFICYWPEKYKDSIDYPKMVLAKCSTDLVAAKYVKKRVLEIVNRENIQPSEKQEPEFLIIGPSKITHYLKNVYKTLVDGNDIDPDIYEVKYKKERETLTINDGYELIKEDPNSNLGWRIILYCNHLPAEEEKRVIRETLAGKSISELLPEEYKKTHIEKADNVAPKKDLGGSKESKKITIKLTSYLGSKGLSANHVFVLGLRDGILPDNAGRISDDELCQFIVLLTRARKSLTFLMSMPFNKKSKKLTENISTFISMLPERLLRAENNIRASDVK